MRGASPLYPPRSPQKQRSSQVIPPAQKVLGPRLRGEIGVGGWGASTVHHISPHIFAAFPAKAGIQTLSRDTKGTHCNLTRSGEINGPTPLSTLMMVCRHAAFGLAVLKPITYSIQSRASPICCSSIGKSLIHKNLIAGDAAAPTSALTCSTVRSSNIPTGR